MKLYEGIGELERIDELMFEMTDEDGIIKDDDDLIIQLETELLEKIENKTDNIIKVIRNTEGQTEMVDLEIKRLTKLKKSNNSKVKNLMNYVKYFMVSTDKKKFESPLGKFTVRESQAVEVVNETILSDKYFKTERTVSKSAIKEDFKSGLDVQGAFLKINRNINLK